MDSRVTGLDRKPMGDPGGSERAIMEPCEAGRDSEPVLPSLEDAGLEG